jgi:hypothetical protein
MTDKELQKARELAEAIPSFKTPSHEEESRLAKYLLNALDEITVKQRGYDDLHQMVPGTGDIWTKVDKLLSALRELRTYALDCCGDVSPAHRATIAQIADDALNGDRA